MTCEQFMSLMSNEKRILTPGERRYVSELHGSECKFCVRKVGSWNPLEEVPCKSKKLKSDKS